MPLPPVTNFGNISVRVLNHYSLVEVAQFVLRVISGKPWQGAKKCIIHSYTAAHWSDCVFLLASRDPEEAFFVEIRKC